MTQKSRAGMFLRVAVCALALVGILHTQNADPTVGEEVTSEETSCVSTLRTINVAEATYWGGIDTRGYIGSLQKLGPSGENLIDAVMASGKKDGYYFHLRAERTVKRSPIRHYTITARPVTRLSNDQRSFFTDDTGVIRFTTKNRDATVKDPAIK